MIPTSFKESNCVLHPPPGMSADDVECLSVWRGTGGCPCGKCTKFPLTISCHKLTVEELETLKKTGRVWCIVLGHNTPPLHLSANSPFEIEDRTCADIKEDKDGTDTDGTNIMG